MEKTFPPEVSARITPQWLAGFFDGEGCVNMRIAGNVPRLRIAITQKDLTILKMISQSFPGGYVSQMKHKLKHGGTTTTWCLTYHSGSCKQVLEFIKDYSVVKWEQVVLALRFCELLTYPGGRLTPEQALTRTIIVGRVREINQNSLATDDQTASESTRGVRKVG